MILFNIAYSQDTISIDSIKLKYDRMNIDSNMPKYEVFKKAYEGFKRYGNKITNNKLTIVDFSLSSNTKRLWVLDIKEDKLLYLTYVSHGIKTGGEYAKYFSNKIGSKKSSLGFYLTAETYKGNNGTSLKLDGLEFGINDNIRVRKVVMHPANYVKYIKKIGFLGRSEGCLALNPIISFSIISEIKEGSLIFVYSNKY